MLVHNKLTMNTDFDIDIVNIELGDILDIDMTQYGFDLENDEEKTDELKEVNYNEKISVVIDCLNEAEAEEIYNKLIEEGYECRISTL